MFFFVTDSDVVKNVLKFQIFSVLKIKISCAQACKYRVCLRVRWKEEGVRLRKIASSTTSSYQSSSSSSPLQQSSSMTTSPLSLDASAVTAQPPVVYLIAMLILGIIVGKFLL